MRKIFDELLLNRLIVIFFLCLYSSGKACVVPFLTLLFKKVGLQAFQAGILRAVQATFAIVFAPICLQVAKRYNHRRSFLAVGILVTSVTYLSLVFIAQVNGSTAIENQPCANDECKNASSIDGIGNSTTRSKRAALMFSQIRPCLLDDKTRTHSSSWCLDRLVIFFILLLVLALCGVLGSHVEKLADDSWYEHLEEIDSLERYGEHKSLITGFTAIVLLIACATVSTVPPHMTFTFHHFFLYFFIFFGINSAAFLLSPFLPIPKAQFKQPTNYRKVFRSFQIIFCDYRNLLFTASVIFAGGFYACIQDYLLWFLEDEGAGEYILGLFVCVGIASELPIPMIYKTIIKAITLNGTVVIAIFVFGFRFILYSLSLNPFYVLPVQLLQGLSNGLIWQATLVHIDQVSNPGMDRHVHSLLYVLYWGVGYSIGTLSGGLMFSFYGAYLMFWAFGSFAFLWGLMFLVMQWYMPKLQKRTYSKLLLSGADDDERMFRLLNSSSGESDDDGEWMEILRLKKQSK